MFTSNFYKCLCLQVNLTDSKSVRNENGVYLTCVRPRGSYYFYWFVGGADGNGSLRLPREQYYGVRFGTGDTPPTLDDYKLSGNNVTGLTFSTNVVWVKDDDGDGATATYTITNNNTTDVTIQEVGLFQQIYTTRSKEDSTYQLWERTVLDSPVTIPAGGVGQITYTLRVNYPTA